MTARVDVDGGGRVSELVARPLLNLAWPQLAGFVQPLAGEFAARRELLEAIPFATGYGVELGMLVDVLDRVGLDAMAQVDLGVRVHRHHDLQALGRMSAQIQLAASARLARQGILTRVPETTTLVQFRRPSSAGTGRPRPRGRRDRRRRRGAAAAARGPRPLPAGGLMAGRPLTVLVDAGPWLPVPPGGYGGIEAVLATLIPELRRLGVRVVLATVGTSRIEVDDRVTTFAEPRFAAIAAPYNRVMGVAAAHVDRVRQELRGRDDIDLVHSHLEAWGLVSYADAGAPVLHTLHWDLAKHPELTDASTARGGCSSTACPAPSSRGRPPALRRHALGHVHLATPLADEPGPPVDPADHLVVLAGLTPAKGQDAAARLAAPDGPTGDPRRPRRTPPQRRRARGRAGRGPPAPGATPTSAGSSTR